MNHKFGSGCLAVALLALSVSSEAYGKKPHKNAGADFNADESASTSGAGNVPPKSTTEKRAAQYSREALGGDFKSGRFLIAEGKLREAIHICESNGCGAPFQARLHRDLGYLYIAGLDRPDSARDEFATATTMDPSVALTPAMQTPEVEQAFNDAMTKGSKSSKKSSKKQGSASETEPEDVDLSSEPSPVSAPPEPDESNHSIIPNWLTLSIQQDWVYHSKTQNACAASSAYHCYDANKVHRVLEPGQYGGNAVTSSGALAATTRILVGFDRVVHPHLSLGVRAGSIISGTSPVVPAEKSVQALHGEARVTAWFGPNVFSRSGIRPYLFLSGGFAEANGRIVVDFNVPGDAATYKLDAWKRSGHTFVSPGFGIQAAITKSTGPIAEVRYMQYFGPSVPVIAAQFGWSVGF